jgi:type II secretory pathway predicted ATPase ExeA
MYLEHFGLKAPPFQFTASPVALFMSRTHREALSALEWGLLHEPSGLTLLIGESGTGKTTLVCALLARQYRHVRAAYIGNPKMAFTELMGSILSQLGVRGGRATKSAMLSAFTAYAMELPLNERIAILIDEAQTLSDDALEEFRLLSNLERHGRKATQIILAGQYELARRLSDPAMRQFSDRIGARAVLLSLSALECREYVEHRLRLCGSSSERIFGRRALDCIVRHSEGVPRRINALCHNALLMAYARGSRRITPAIANEAAAEYAGAFLERPLSPGKRQNWLPARLAHSVRWLRPMLGLTVLGMAGFITGQMLMEHNPIAQLRHWKASASAGTGVLPTVEIDSRISAAPRPAAAVKQETQKADPPAVADGRSAAAAQPGSESVVKVEATAAGAVVSTSLKTASANAESMPASVAGAPASTGPSLSAASASRRPFVVVAPGDTLGGIAIRHLGSFFGFRNLMRLNPHITDAARVYPGEIVYLPPSSVTSSSGNADDTDVE